MTPISHAPASVVSPGSRLAGASSDQHSAAPEHFSPCPKPARAPKVHKPWAEKFRDRLKAMTPEERRAEWDKKKPRKAIARKTYLPRATKPIPQRNEKRIARKAVAYRKVIASDFHKQIRYQAYLRSGGFCECDECAQIRSAIERMGFLVERPPWTKERIDLARTEIPCWFTRGGGEPWRRFKSNDGETHHMSYKYFGKENPAELEVVQFAWKVCHRRIEAEFGTRRRFLSGRKAA